MNSLRIVILLLLGATTLRAQPYQHRFRTRPMLWTEMGLAWKFSDRWSVQLDHQYRRQAGDRNGRDLNILRYPLQQVFRPWVSYQASKAVRLSLSPVGLWWTWGQTSELQPTTFTQEIRIIPQLQITKPLLGGDFTQRYRTELRWPSALDTLTSAYIFLSDGESTRVLADRFNVRLRAMARWQKPILRRSAADRRWYIHASFEPMAVVGRLARPGVEIRFDQNRTYLALGRRLRDNLRVEVGYLNQFSIRTNYADRIRTYQFNNALHLFLYLENRRPTSRASGTTGPEE